MELHKRTNAFLSGTRTIHTYPVLVIAYPVNFF